MEMDMTFNQNTNRGAMVFSTVQRNWGFVLNPEDSQGSNKI